MESEREIYKYLTGRQNVDQDAVNYLLMWAALLQLFLHALDTFCESIRYNIISSFLENDRHNNYSYF